MLAVKEEHRGKGIATKLVRMAIDAMIARGAEEVCRLSSASTFCTLAYTLARHRSRSKPKLLIVLQ